MSIVPKEVVTLFYLEWLDSAEPGDMPQYIAGRAAEWAFEQALGKLAAEYVDAEATLAPEDRAYNAAVGHCEDAIRALMKGGESDEQS
jgi:hypothetical protein